MLDGLISNVLCVALIEEFTHDGIWQETLALTPGHLNSLLTKKELGIISALVTLKYLRFLIPIFYIEEVLSLLIEI